MCLGASLDWSGPILDVWSCTSALPLPKARCLEAGYSSQLTYWTVCKLVLRVSSGVLLWAVDPGSPPGWGDAQGVSDLDFLLHRGCWVRDWTVICFCLEDQVFVSPLKQKRIAPSSSQLQEIYLCSRSRNCKAQAATKWCVNRTWWTLFFNVFKIYKCLNLAQSSEHSLGKDHSSPALARRPKTAEEKAWKCSLNSICCMNHQYVILFLLDFAPRAVYNED